MANCPLLVQIFLTAFVLFLTIDYSEGIRCKRKIFGSTFKYDCPQPGDDPENLWCCGSDFEMKCCRVPDEIMGEDDGIKAEPLKAVKTVKKTAKRLGIIIAIVVVIVIALGVGGCICCCVCPFCLLYKRRQQGTVYGSNLPQNAQVSHTVPTGYVQVAAYPPVGTYPQQPQPVYPPYPIQQQAGNVPPPYPTNESYAKQAPFNPNY